MNTHTIPSRRGFGRRAITIAAILSGSLLGLNSARATDNEVWAGIPSSTTTTNWSDTLNWSGTSHNANDNNLFFVNTGPALVGTVDNVVDTSTNCFSLNFTNTVNTHTTLILPGQTLKIDGAISGVALNANPNGQFQATNNITGQYGAVVITGASAGGVFVSTTNSSAGNLAATLDMSGLGTFIVSNVASSATMAIGNGANRCDGVIYLAMTNYLKLPATGTGNSSALVVGDNTSNNGSSPGGVVNLGITNQIFADNIGLGLSKQNAALMRFNPVFTNGGANPVVIIRGNSTTGVKNWSIGDGLSQSGTSAAGTGTADFRNGTVNAVVTGMVLGRPSSTSTSSPNSAGTLWIGNNSTFSVVNLTNGFMTTVAGVTGSGSPTNQTAKGVINIEGSAVFNANTVFMANQLGTGGSGTGTIGVTNGTLAIGTMTVGAGTSTISLNSGTFIVTNTVGTPTAPLTALNLTGGTIQLNINGAAIVTNIITTAVNPNGTTTIAINSIGAVTSTTTFPLISYTGTSPFGSLTLAALPNSYTGILVDDTAKQTIDVQVSPPVAAAPVVWVGATNAILTSSWDTTTTNWVDAATRSIPTTYADLDPVQFDDSASNNIVTLTTNVAPFSLLVTNNALNYTFNGTGKISGTTSLIKDGPGSLTLSESGGDSFNGGITVSNGTVVLDNAGAGISGGVNIVSGTVQVGNNAANGNLPSGAIANNGQLVFNRTDNLTVSTAMTGSGSVTKNNNNTLTLSANSVYSGGLTAKAGIVRLAAVGAAGTGVITVTNTGTVVLGAVCTNNIVLAGGTLGTSVTLNPFTNDLSITTGTTSFIYCADPQNLAAVDATEMDLSNSISGSGNIIVVTVTNDTSTDSGNGFRFRSTTPVSFSGSVTFSNNVKGELQTAVAGPYSPAGTAVIKMLAGAAVLNNSTTNPLIAGGYIGYTEMNLRNNSTGDTVFGNDLEILGSGLALLNPLGNAPAAAKVTMGNLKIGGGQELGVYLSSGNTHNIVFPTVTLTGGTATFSPKTPGFGATASVGSDLTLGSISELSAAGITMNGLRTLTFTGNNSYSGSTLVNNGTLEVDGFNHGTGSVTVNSGATLTGIGGIAGPVSVAANGTLSPGNATTTYAMLVVSNSLALAGTNVMDVNKTGSVILNDVITNITTVTYGGTLQLNLTGAALAAGDAIKLYGCNSGVSAFAAIIPAAPGSGLLWDTSTLSSGVLSVIPAVNTGSTNITAVVTGTNLALSWPADHIGWRLQVQTNALAAGLNTNWTDVAGGTTTNLINVTLDALNGAVFYRMVYP